MIFSREIVEELTEMCLTDDILPLNQTIETSTAGSIKLFAIYRRPILINQKPYFFFIALAIRIMRTGFLGELGYELHIDNDNCLPTYIKAMDIGLKYELKNAGFRSFNSLNCEAGK